MTHDRIQKCFIAVILFATILLFTNLYNLQNQQKRTEYSKITNQNIDNSYHSEIKLSEKQPNPPSAVKTLFKRPQKQQTSKNLAKIFFFRRPFKNFPPAFNFEFCYPNINCEFQFGDSYDFSVRNIKNVESADVVVMHPLQLMTPKIEPREIATNWKDYRQKSRNQTGVQKFRAPWIFYQWESPEFHHDVKFADNYTVLDGFFDASMSYRSDSDIYFPYSSIQIVKYLMYYGETGSYFLQDESAGEIKLDELKQAELDAYFKKLKHPYSLQNSKNKNDQLILDRYFDRMQPDCGEIEKLEKSNKNCENIRPLSSVADLHRFGAISICSNPASTYRTKNLKRLDQYINDYESNSTSNMIFDQYGNCEKYVQKYKNGTHKREPQGARKEKLWLERYQQLYEFTTLIPLIRQYKFYFAFENSKCVDYITEKLFYNSLLANVVPVVAGPPRWQYEKLIPGDAFIHLDDFGDEDDDDSVKIEGLAEYLIRLSQVEYKKEYLGYFDWWKRDHSMTGVRFSSMLDYSENFGWCKLCKLANAVKNGEYGGKNGLNGEWKHEIENGLETSQSKYIHEWWYGSKDKLVRGSVKSRNSTSICETIRREKRAG